MERMSESIKENKMTIGRTKEEKTREEKMREEKTKKEDEYRQDQQRHLNQPVSRHDIETMMAQTSSALLYLCRSHDSNLNDQGDIPTSLTTFLFLSLIKLN